MLLQAAGEPDEEPVRPDLAATEAMTEDDDLLVVARMKCGSDAASLDIDERDAILEWCQRADPLSHGL